MMPNLSLSLRTKITIIAVSVSLAMFVFLAFVTNKWILGEIKEQFEKKADLYANDVARDIEGIISPRTTSISEMIASHRLPGMVDEIRIFDLNGKEIFTDKPGPPLPKVPEALGRGARLFFLEKKRGDDYALFIAPIRNGSGCRVCHGKEEKALGAVLVSMSTRVLGGYEEEEKLRFYVLFTLLSLAVGLITIGVVNRLLLRPLDRIKRGTEEIGRGRFTYRIPVSSGDEIGALAKDFNGMAVTLQTLISDLEEKNRMLDEQFRLVSNSQKEWQMTFDGITDMIAVIDSDCNIRRCNTACARHTGLEPKDLINKKCYDVLYKSGCPDECPHRVTVRDRLPALGELWDADTRKIFQVSAFPYFSDVGEFAGAIYISRDTTAAKEQEVRFIMNERLAALGQMASGIAHEINNPLATISGCVEGLLKRARKGDCDPAFFEEYLKIIEEEVARCQGITTTMLSFVRRSAFEEKDIYINETLDKVVNMMGLQGRMKDVAVIKKYDDVRRTVHVREGEMIQVFLTIITNALDAMEEKGALTLETASEAGRVLVRISDTGCGIPAEHLSSIFLPFFTTKAERGGAGLGLSIAKRLVEDNNGVISVTSEKGKGTTFEIRLEE